jgi:WD40 repeat protein
MIAKRAFLLLALVVVTETTALAQESKKDLYGDPLPPGVIARLGTNRLRSSNDIDRVVLSPDAKIVVTTRDHCPLEVWDGRTGQLLRTIPMVQHKAEPLVRGDDRERLIPEEVAAMAFSSDSRKLHVLTEKGVLRTCDVIDGKWSEPIARTAGPVVKEFGTDFSGGRASPDGTHFAYTPHLKPYRLEVFVVGKDKPVLELKDEKLPEWGRVACFSDDNKLIGMPLDDATVKVWEVASGRHVATYRGPDLRLLNFAFSPDGKWIAAVYAPKDDRLRLADPLTLVIWDTATGKERLRLADWKGFIVGCTRDGSTILSWDYPRAEVILADAVTGKVTGRLKGHGDIRGFAFSADGKHFATCGGRDRSVIVWDLTTGKPALDFDAPRGPVNTIVFSPDGKTVFTTTAQENVGWLWDAQTGAHKQRLVAEAKGYPQTAAFTSDGKHVVAGYGYGIISGGNRGFSARLWSVSDGKLVREFGDHTDGVLNVALSPDGKQLVTRDCTGGKVRLWELDTGKLTKEIAWGERNEALLAYPKVDELLGVARDPKAGHATTNLISGKVVATWKTDGRRYAHAISPDGRLVASREDMGRNGEQFVLRLAATGEMVCQLPLTHVSHLSCVAFSSDGKTVAVSKGHVGFTDKDTAHLYDTTTGKELRTFRAQKRGICSLAFSPDGKRLATGSTDTTVLIWDLTTQP